MNALAGPMSVWEILDRSVRLYRRHVKTIFPAAALVTLAIYPANRLCLFALLRYVAGLDRTPSTVMSGLSALLVVLAMSALILALSFIQTGVMAVLIREAYIEGRLELSSAFRKIPFGSLALSSLLAACVINLALVPLVVPAFVLAISFALVPLVSALQGTGAVDSLRQSWGLVRARMRGGFWNSNVTRIVVIWGFGMVVLMLGYAIVASLANVLPESWKTTRALHVPGWGTFPMPALRMWPGVALDVVGQVICAFFQPFVFCALVLLYYDIRVAKDGIDIEQALDGLRWNGE